MKTIHTLMLLTFLILGMPTVEAQTLHAIIFANTKCPGDPDDPNDHGIGPSVTADFQRMNIEFKTMANFIGYKADIQVYKDTQSQFCREKLDAALDNLTCGKDDIVFFYYSGHGGRRKDNVTDQFPHMQLIVNPYHARWNPSDYYPLSKVLARIKAKNPRLTIVLGDLCNSYSNIIPSKELPEMKGATKMSKAPCDFYRDLFLSVKGHIITASSKPGETSAAFNAGGAYTIGFSEALQTMVSENMKPDWEVLLEASKLRTQHLTRGSHMQTPIYETSLQRVGHIPATTTATPTPQPTAPAIQESASLEECLTAIGSSSTPVKERIRLASTTIPKFFASPTAKVEILGKDGKTIVATKYARQYIDNLSIARNLSKVLTVNHEETQGGKISYLKVHEIYQ